MKAWTNEERDKILQHWLAKNKMTSQDFKELEAHLPGRTFQQIKDQYRCIVKPQTIGLFLANQPSSSSAASSAPSTPRKRVRAKDEDSDGKRDCQAMAC